MPNDNCTLLVDSLKENIQLLGNHQVSKEADFGGKYRASALLEVK